MWGTLFLIAGWLTITPPTFSQYSDTTNVILLEFSEPMAIDSLLYTGNYMVLCNDTSDHKIYRIHKVGIVRELDSIQIADTTLIALITDRVPYRKSFNVFAKNIKDRAGNYIDSTKSVWFFHNGFVPNKLQIPGINLRRK